MPHKIQEKRIQQLIQLGDEARSGVAREASSLRSRFDVTARFRESLKRRPTVWVIGSMAVGLLAAGLLRRKLPDQEVPAKKKRGLPMVLFGLTLTAVRPFAKVWLADQVRNYLTAQMGRQASPRPNNHTPSQPF